MPEIGDIAPDFTLPQDGGRRRDPVDGERRAIVLYFYPRDDTPGCTKEAIAFTELLPEFAALGAKIMGVSRDTVAKHGKFRAKHELGVQLLSDEDAAVCELYGVWQEKNMYGKTSMGIVRSTFLIDSDGKIAQVWPKVKVAGHAEAVLEGVKAL